MNDYLVEIWYVYSHCFCCSGHLTHEDFSEVAKTPKSALKKALKDWGKHEQSFSVTPIRGMVWFLDKNVYKEIL